MLTSGYDANMEMKGLWSKSMLKLCEAKLRRCQISSVVKLRNGFNKRKAKRRRATFRKQSGPEGTMMLLIFFKRLIWLIFILADLVNHTEGERMNMSITLTGKEEFNLLLLALHKQDTWKGNNRNSHKFLKYCVTYKLKQTSLCWC